MGSKNDPGQFDCYANAEPDEPMFVLLGRDRHAPTLVWLWSVLRELDQEDPQKLKEARECAVNMAAYLASKGRQTVGISHSVLAGIFELMRCANYAIKNATSEATTLDIFRKFLCESKLQPDPA